MRIGVLGATGYIGGRLVPELIAAGHDVTCVARAPERLAGRPWRRDVRVAAGDVLDRDSLLEAFAGLDAVYHLVHSMGHNDDFAGADRTGAANVAAAAATARVGHLIYLGGLGDDDDPSLSPHLRSRHEVGRILGAGPVPTTELRAAIIIGSGSASFEMLRSLVEVLPVMLTPRWVNHTRCQPVAITDVLTALVGLLHHPPAGGGHRVLDIGGPEVVTYRQMMDLYATQTGLPRRLVLPVPVLTPLLSAHWVNLVTALPIDLARPLIESQVNDVLVRPHHDVRAVVPFTPLPLAEAVARALMKVQQLEVRTRWSDAAPRRPADPYPGDPSWSGGTLLVDERHVTSTAGPEALFAEVCAIGGERGWHGLDWAWKLRGLVDALVGGPGMRRGRRHPTELRVGDALDFFRVAELEDHGPDGGRLRLRAEMRVPGSAWLEWEVAPADAGATLGQRALFHPRGILGRAYWYGLLPIHRVIFARMAATIAQAQSTGATEAKARARSSMAVRSSASALPTSR